MIRSQASWSVQILSWRASIPKLVDILMTVCSPGWKGPKLRDDFLNDDVQKAVQAIFVRFLISGSHNQADGFISLCLCLCQLMRVYSGVWALRRMRGNIVVWQMAA